MVINRIKAARGQFSETEDTIPKKKQAKNVTNFKMKISLALFSLSQARKISSKDVQRSIGGNFMENYQVGNISHKILSQNH